MSVRTLQRAFASLDESFSAYIRRRRLEEAAEALTASGSQLSVSEAAALWHFTDSSHFIRAFKKQYHATPAQVRTPPDVTTQPAAAGAAPGGGMLGAGTRRPCSAQHTNPVTGCRDGTRSGPSLRRGRK
ncbi:helix-turn-helix transcriptional regulator [Streptomyces sp. NPDC014991]|uniref:helix-turn-helix transcriptional regulator n=1 Tax=Streptomyces sp. NPDC014991 TaxID=3364935 RepID=UPI0036FE5F33